MTLALFSAWNRRVVDGVFDAYEMALGDLPDDVVKLGVARVIQGGGEHPPSAGQVRQVCIGRSPDDLSAAAHAAFVRADRHARTVGLSGSVRQLGDPLITHAIGSVGGWQAFCTHVDEWQKRNFVQAYMDALANPQTHEVAKLSHDGKPVGALQDMRAGVAEKLRIGDT